MMIDLLRNLFQHRKSDFQEILPILRVIIHSPALEEVVRASPNKIDDLVLRILRALIPPEG